MLKDSKRLQQHKVKKVGIISDFSNIVIEGIKTVFFFTNFKKKKTQIQLLTNLKKNLAH